MRDFQYINSHHSFDSKKSYFNLPVEPFFHFLDFSALDSQESSKIYVEHAQHVARI